MESNLQMIQVLKGLLVVCRASELGYLAAAEAIPSNITRQILCEYADQRREFADQLRTEIRFHSGSWFDVEPPAHSLISIHSTNFRGNKKDILQQCEHSEEAMMRVYEDALSRKAPWDVHSVLSEQYQHIKETHHFLNTLEQVSSQYAA